MKSFCWLIGSMVLAAVGLVLGSPSAAQELFRDEMVDDTNWGVNASSIDTTAMFNWNYSIDGLPEAPNSRGGDAATRGLLLEANLGSETSQFLTVYPLGQNFTGSHQLRFDAWMNYDVQESVQGNQNGTTEFLGGGVGYDNATADVASGAQAITTGDGDSASDWRAFKSPPQFFIDAADMVAGSHNSSDPYYSDFFPGVVPPGAQGQPDLEGNSGVPGFQWITWEFTAINDNGRNDVIVTVEKPTGERLPIVEIDCNDTSDGSSGCATEGNISLFYADFFTSVTPNPQWTFGIIDNVEVSVFENPVLSGDYNENGVVDAADYTVWRDLLGQEVDLPNETQTPGMVTQEDYDEWVAQFGMTGGAASGTLSNSGVPEPSSALLMAFVVVAGLPRRRAVA